MVLTAHFAIALHMLCAWQVFSQPIFDLIESQVKVRVGPAGHASWRTRCQQAAGRHLPDTNLLAGSQAWRIRRQLRRARAKAAAAPAEPQPAASIATNGGCSGLSSVPAPLEVVAEQGSQQEASSHIGEPPDGPLGRRHLSSRSAHGGPLTFNSAPLPDLLPPKRQWVGGQSCVPEVCPCLPDPTACLPACLVLLVADAPLLPSTLDTPSPGWAHQETFFRRAFLVEARATDVLPPTGTAPIQRSGSRCALQAPLALLGLQWVLQLPGPLAPAVDYSTS